MKPTLRLSAIAFLFLFNYSFAQESTESNVITCEHFAVTRPLRELIEENPVNVKKVIREHRKEHQKESDKRSKYREPQHFEFNLEEHGDAYGNDPSLFQNEPGSRPGPPQRINVPGQAANSAPHDPSGAAGTTYYLQAINATPVRVINKATGVTEATFTLGSLWTPSVGNMGDPIVMYDRFADRWFLAQFGSSNKIYIAISATSDPLGSYYTYTYTSPQFPDYLKFSIWGDAYYMTSNQSSQKLFAFERTAMLAGSPTARSVYSAYTPQASGNGFFCPLPGDADGTNLPTAGTPCPIFYYTDNAWGGGNIDGVKIYNATVNWVPATPTLSVNLLTTVPTSSFDASYNNQWNDIAQPGTTQKLDGIGGVATYRAQYRKWSGYNSVVMNWGVKISTTQRSIMWVELRQDQATGIWSVYQQSIYTPDSYYRWIGSIAMDDYGNIALCYAKSGSSTVYPSLAYAARLAGDPLNQLTVAESMATTGTVSQPTSWYGGNRWGDYSHTSLDPDGGTFWHTGEWCGGTASNPKKTQVYSFLLMTPTTAVVSITSSDANNAICEGESVTFTATPTNGGSAPTYQWYLNGSLIPGETMETYTTTTVSTGDIVSCQMTSNLPDATNNPASSNSITTTVTQFSSPAVSVSGTTTVCEGSNAAFIAASTNAGTSPVYQWQIDGNNVGTNSSSLVTSALTDGSVVTVTLTSNANCANPATVTSSPVTITVTLAPTAPTITNNAGTLTSSATSSNQWYYNGSIITGATSQTYVPTANGNYTVVTTVDGCPSASSAAYTVSGLGINELENLPFNIYPNPNNGTFFISFNAVITKDYEIKVYDEAGRLVHEEKVSNQSGETSKEITIKDPANGLYNVILKDGSFETTRKLVVKH